MKCVGEEGTCGFMCEDQVQEGFECAQDNREFTTKDTRLSMPCWHYLLYRGTFCFMISESFDVKLIWGRSQRT